MKANFTESGQFSNSRISFSKKSLLFSIILVLLSFTKLYAQPYVNLLTNPAVTNTTVGQNITIQIGADYTSANPADAFQINLIFDPAVLQVTAVSNISSLLSIIGPSFDNTAGTINFVGADLSAPFPTADFAILSISFDVIAVPGGGSTNLIFNRPPTEVASASVSVLNTTTNGIINISGVGCTPPTATISAAPTCDANAFNLILATAPAPTGTAPFDLTITSPLGTATYNNISVGGIITNFAPPTARIWPAAPAPLPPTSEDASITLGVQFQSSVTGFVKGVRFFSPDDAGIPGTFTGQLWTAGGTLLASGTFTGVVVDSWNELLFTEPILISAATTYVASYHTNAIKYVGTAGGLAAPVVNGSLTALANGGLYSYGGAVTFPVNATGNNYWADVIFSPNNYAFNLTGVKDALECTSNGALQTLNVTSIDCSTLPVSLINFSATPKDNAVLLRWATASEFNNLGFELQRSIDGNNGWSAIAFVNGAGNSNSTLNYSYVDENLSARRYYYRLKQIDIDQRFAYSAIVSALLDGSETFGLQQNYPNPFRGETIIRFTLPQKTTINLSIFDMNGRLVKVLANGSKDSGTHAVTLNSGVLTSGLYYYKLQAGDFSAVKKLTVR
jgi:hypothetical protein